jgi:hypothetical protein
MSKLAGDIDVSVAHHRLEAPLCHPTAVVTEELSRGAWIFYNGLTLAFEELEGIGESLKPLWGLVGRGRAGFLSRNWTDTRSCKAEWSQA